MNNTEPVVAFVAISDSVIREHGTGKLSLIGCCHGITFRKFPSSPRTLCATVTLTNIPVGILDIALAIRIELEGIGHVVASTGGNIKIEVKNTVEKASFDARKGLFDIPLRFPNVVFPKPGVYSIVVLADNEPIGKRNFVIQESVLLQAPPTENKP